MSTLLDDVLQEMRLVEQPIEAQTEWLNQCHFGDVRDVLRRMIADGVKVQTIVTSPPYWGLRDYGHAGQIGLEPTLPEFIAALVETFDLCRQVLADDGTAWVNMGDSYAQTGGRGAQGSTSQRLGRSNVEAQMKGVSQRPDRPALASGLRPAGCRLVSAPRHHLVPIRRRMGLCPHAKGRYASHGQGFGATLPFDSQALEWREMDAGSWLGTK